MLLAWRATDVAQKALIVTHCCKLNVHASKRNRVHVQTSMFLRCCSRAQAIPQPLEWLQMWIHLSSMSFLQQTEL